MENKLKQEPSHCLKVVLFGPESTGKTTLSEQLASHYNSICVPEYAREYLQQKWNNERKTCEPQDLLPIAIGQIKSENKLAKKNRLGYFRQVQEKRNCRVEIPFFLFTGSLQKITCL